MKSKIATQINASTKIHFIMLIIINIYGCECVTIQNLNYWFGNIEKHSDDCFRICLSDGRVGLLTNPSCGCLLRHICVSLTTLEQTCAYIETMFSSRF